MTDKLTEQDVDKAADEISEKFATTLEEYGNYINEHTEFDPIAEIALMLSKSIAKMFNNKNLPAASIVRFIEVLNIELTKDLDGPGTGVMKIDLEDLDLDNPDDAAEIAEKLLEMMKNLPTEQENQIEAEQKEPDFNDEIERLRKEGKVVIDSKNKLQ